MTTKSKMTQKTLKELEKITGTKLTLGKLLLAIRQSDDITQVDFAGQLHITRQQLCDIERGRKMVSSKMAASYAKILGYSKGQFTRLALQDCLSSGIDH